MKQQYITKQELADLWKKKAICIEFADSSDALVQENGYTLEQCLVMNDARFFLD